MDSFAPRAGRSCRRSGVVGEVRRSRVVCVGSDSQPADLGRTFGNMTEGATAEGHRHERELDGRALVFAGPTLPPSHSRERAILRRNPQGAVYLSDG
jgi:hypothetical protein